MIKKFQKTIESHSIGKTKPSMLLIIKLCNVCFPDCCLESMQIVESNV